MKRRRKGEIDILREVLPAMVQCLDISTLRLYLYSNFAINEQQSGLLETITPKEEAMMKLIQYLPQNCRLDPARKLLEALQRMQSSRCGSDAVQDLINTLEQRLDALDRKRIVYPCITPKYYTLSSLI